VKPAAARPRGARLPGLLLGRDHAVDGLADAVDDLEHLRQAGHVGGPGHRLDELGRLLQKLDDVAGGGQLGHGQPRHGHLRLGVDRGQRLEEVGQRGQILGHVGQAQAGEALHLELGQLDGCERLEFRGQQLVDHLGQRLVGHLGHVSLGRQLVHHVAGGADRLHQLRDRRQPELLPAGQPGVFEDLVYVDDRDDVAVGEEGLDGGEVELGGLEVLLQLAGAAGAGGTWVGVMDV